MKNSQNIQNKLTNPEKNRIFPSWEEIPSLTQPLTDGELRLASFLDENLPKEWEIYLQPYLNGDRPDIIIMNENVGIMIIEVKDYNYDSYYSRGYRNHKNQFMVEYFVKTKQGNVKIGSPVAQVNNYRKKMISLYVPKIGEAIDRNKKILASISVGVYMHNMSTIKAHDLVKENRYCNVFGSDWLKDSANISEVVPGLRYRKSKYFKSEWAKEIRFWLLPPYHSIEQGSLVKLTHEQSRHSNPSAYQHQRLRGVAGSGKSVVIAHRAAKLASEGKKVLIVSYNITLWHYLRDLISKVRAGFGWDKIEFNHFHNFCKDYLLENNVPWPEGKFSDNDWLEMIPNIVCKLHEKGKNTNNRLYDAILIDEGQDFHMPWYKTLCRFLSNNDEMLLVIDEKQNIYQRENTWIDNMAGTKFRGRWRTLGKSFRLPFAIAEKAREFSQTFLDQNGMDVIPSKDEINLFDPILNWNNLDNDENIKDLVLDHFNYLTKEKGQHPSDIAILVIDHKIGKELVSFFQKRLRVDANHIFDMDQKFSFANKKSFYLGDGRLKICTIHSFKGWELKNLIIVVPSEHDKPKQLDTLLYTSITRTLSNILVLNCHSRYSEFGEKWPKDLKLMANKEA